MYNCIFTGHCIEDGICNGSCPILAQTAYLLERNGIAMNNSVFKMSAEEIAKYSNLLSIAHGRIASVVVSGRTFTNQAADALTYCAICDNWKGSQLHCTTYNLKFSQYIESLQKSWSSANSDETSSYMEVWATQAKVLIISNIDFVNFKDFQCQKLLSLLQVREGTDMTTIIVCPPISSIVGEGRFFGRLTDILNRQRVGDVG